MKRSFVTMLAFFLALSLCACGIKEREDASSSSQTAMIPNPVEQLSHSELVERTGIPLPMPEGAEDISYSLINLSDEAPVAQLQCSLRGYDICYRAQAVPGSELKDISGMYYDWESVEEISVSHCSGELRLCGDAGCISWLDVAPGIQYSLSMSENAHREILLELAELLFDPVQGEA